MMDPFDHSGVIVGRKAPPDDRLRRAIQYSAQIRLNNWR